MKKFKYLLPLAFWSFTHIVIGQCPNNSIPVEGTKFKKIYDDYSLLFDAYEHDNTVVMSSTVDPFFKSYLSQIKNSTICLNKNELRKCITKFNKVLTQASALPDGTTNDGRNRLKVLKTVIDELKKLETSAVKKTDPIKTAPSPKSTNVIRNPDDNESDNWAWFVSVFFGLTTLGLGFWLWKLWDKQKQINLTLSHLSDKLVGLLGNSDSTYQPNSNENQLERIESLIHSLVSRFSIFSKDKQEVERLTKNIERYKKNEKDLLDQKEAISSEFENYKITVAKSMGNKTGLVTNKLDTFLQNFEQASQQPTKQFYLSYASPSSDGMGEFYDKRQPQPNSANSYYRFEIEPDEVNAKFWFHDTAGTVEGAIRYPDTYLSPACEYSAMDRKAKHILTKKEGIARRTGDVWKVYRKAVIEFR